MQNAPQHIKKTLTTKQTEIKATDKEVEKIQNQISEFQKKLKEAKNKSSLLKTEANAMILKYEIETELY